MIHHWIETENEPDGEGNGWDSCQEQHATSWVIYKGTSLADPHCTQVEAYGSRAEAEKMLAIMQLDQCYADAGDMGNPLDDEESPDYFNRYIAGDRK